MPLASGVTVEAVERALTGVEALIHQQSVVLLYQDAGREDREREYFAFHRLRFRETLARMTRRLSPGARVLDVGSHFLHMALSLQALGFRVDGVDTERYAAHPALAGRARSGLVVQAIGSLDQLPFPDACFDGIAFLEVLEHLTINPVPAWKELARLLRPGGVIFVTTPNFYRVGGGSAGFRQAWRFLRGWGTGLPVRHILAEQTGGHHWKEYSRREVREYFALLGWRILAMDSFNYLPGRRRWLKALKRHVRALQDCLYVELTRDS